MSNPQSKDSALYVYLSWQTRGGHPALASDEIRQAAYLAITSRIRSQFCRILAIGGSAKRIHLIAQFPPSLSISSVARMAQESGGAAVAHQVETFLGELINREHLWDTDFTTHTMGQMEPLEARAYLRTWMDAEDGSAQKLAA